MGHPSRLIRSRSVIILPTFRFYDAVLHFFGSSVYVDFGDRVTCPICKDLTFAVEASICANSRQLRIGCFSELGPATNLATYFADADAVLGLEGVDYGGSPLFYFLSL